MTNAVMDITAREIGPAEASLFPPNRTAANIVQVNRSLETDFTDLPDEEIIRQILDGDVDAFELLMTRYREHVMRIAARHLPYDEVEEAAQEIFIRVYKSLPSYKNQSSFKQWISSIAVRNCYDYWRRHYRNREIPLSSLSDNHQDWLEAVSAPDAKLIFDSSNSQKEARELLDWSLAKLSAEERMVLELVHLEGHSVKEAARLLGWSAANVKVRAFRARKKLYNIINQVMEDDGYEYINA